MKRTIVVLMAMMALLAFGGQAAHAQGAMMSQSDTSQTMGSGMMSGTPGQMSGQGNQMMEHNAMMQAKEPPRVTSAVCVLQPTAGNDVSGVVRFTQTDKGVRIVADVKGLTPGKHGFHIHQYGDCTAPDGTSAGGHFNPFDTKHGGPMATEHHEGDMGNLVAGQDGTAHYDWVDPSLYLNGPYSIVGHAIVVHAGEDDLTSQPTGAAGARVACGVIGTSKD